MTPRRAWLVGGVALAAAAAGGGWSWWRGRSAPPAGFWDLRFPRPEGGELALAVLRGKPLVLNFWATWCPPCIKELPQLDRFQRDFGTRGWQVVGLAIDGPKPVREFLRKMPLGFAVGLAGLEGTELTRQLGNTQGALPFTVLLDAHGRVVRRKLGETSYNELVGWSSGV